MNTKLLRQKVLDLAIHGKLVPQNPEHEPASKLLERIRGESLPLATAGKPSSTTPSPRGKAPKTLAAPISEDEIPFEIPENWCWCRLGEICDYGKCKNSNPQDFNENSWILDLEDIEKDTGKILQFITFKERNSLSTKHVFQKGDLLYNKLRPYLNKVVIAPMDGFCTSEILPLNFNGILSSNFAQRLLMSSYFLNTVNLLTYGVKMPRLGSDDAKKILIPLPPLEEQKLIVEEIERIFALIDTVEQNKTDLETVIKQTKSKILDLAIHGKLVPQDKTDEPASKMLEKLRAEKEEKISKGQLKRDKNDSYIYKSANGKWLERKADGSEEEIEVPFEIPESWSWCHAVDLYNIRSAIRIHKSDWKDKGIPFFRGRDLVELARTGNVHPEVFITEELYELNKSKGGVPQKDDILVSAVGTLGCVHIVEGTKKFYYKDAYILCFENIYNLNSKYVKYVIESDYTHDVIYDGSKGTTIDQLTIENAKALWIPFPPLDEQNRIVSMIDNSVQFLEKIKNQI